jgi:hypothetical protein
MLAEDRKYMMEPPQKRDPGTSPIRSLQRFSSNKILVGSSMKMSDSVIAFPRGDLSSLPDESIPAIRLETPELLVLRQQRARRKRRGTFVLGPIPLSWVCACQQAGPGALALALGIRAYEKMRGAAVPVSDTLGRRLGLSADQRRRALVALEAAGLARVERQPGRSPLATLTPPEVLPRA